MTVLIVDAEIEGVAGQRVRLDADHVVEVGPHLRSGAGEDVVDARGGAVMPGLHDHHVHLRSAAAAARSLALDPVSLARGGGFESTLRHASLRLAAGEWLRGVGISGPGSETLDRWALDAVVADRPVRLQHRTGELWVLNSAGVVELGIESWSEPGVERAPDGTATGRLWRLDDALRGTGGADAGLAAGLERWCADALAMGITGFTDATPGLTMGALDDVASLVAAGVVHQRVTLMAGPELRSAQPSHVRLGPQKIVLDDPTLPTERDLARTVLGAHRHGVPVAVHCVTADQLVVATAALASAGALPGDRIEHAGVVPPGYADVLARLAVTVVTQPGFIAARGDDYLRDVDGAEREWLYPCASLSAAGVAVAAGSDAPFGPLDPWVGMRAAVSRRAASGAVVGVDECVDEAVALGLYLGHAAAPGRPRRIRPGDPGEVCVLRRPMRDVLSDLGAHQVAGVIVRGEVHTWDG